MMDDAALLDALVVTASDDFVGANQHGADGDATGGEALFGLINGGLEERVGGHKAATMASPISMVPTLRARGSEELKISPVRWPAAMARATAFSMAMAASLRLKL